jgi:SAM-dependent methyltransferase
MILIKLKKKISGNKVLRKILHPTYRMFSSWYSFWREYPIYRKNRKTYNSKNERESFIAHRRFDYPIYGERFQEAGTLSQYFWQDLWAARLIAEINPEEHFDIGSRVDGFIGHLASFRDNITLIDVRPLQNVIPGVNFIQADATSLEGVKDESISSLSALCSLEHFGLGRYGDTVDPEACFKVFKSINRVVKPGGHIYIAVPIGKEHVEFDAHRVFYAKTIIEAFKNMRLEEFSCIAGNQTEIERNVPIDKYDQDLSGGGRFGLFHFYKEYSI